MLHTIFNSIVFTLKYCEFCTICTCILSVSWLSYFLLLLHLDFPQGITKVLSIYLSISIYISSIYLSIYLSVHLSVYLSIYLSIHCSTSELPEIHERPGVSWSQRGVPGENPHIPRELLATLGSPVDGRPPCKVPRCPLE